MLHRQLASLETGVWIQWFSLLSVTSVYGGLGLHGSSFPQVAVCRQEIRKDSSFSSHSIRSLA